MKKRLGQFQTYTEGYILGAKYITIRKEKLENEVEIIYKVPHRYVYLIQKPVNIFQLYVVYQPGRAKLVKNVISLYFVPSHTPPPIYG